MPKEWIQIRGAREHNLKDVSVRIPRDRLTVITGLSGSGKSSLAFDTLYAEGQRKYVESLSAYARQFLEQLQKPDVDDIDGLSPAISIEQRTAGSNPRSTVATTTEIHDYLRLLFAHVGTAHCPACGKPIARQTAEEIVERLLNLPDATRLMILAPRVHDRKGAHAEVIDEIRRSGFVRVRLDGAICDVESLPEIKPRARHSIDVVVDRLIMNDKVRSRLTDSVEAALHEGNGMLTTLIQTGADTWAEALFSEKNACIACGVSFDVLTPRHFSFNSPYGACPRCQGLGTMEVIDADLVVSHPEKSIENGAVEAWNRGGRRLIIYYKKLLRAVANHYEADVTAPYESLPQSFRDVLLNGSGDEVVPFNYYRGSKMIKTAKPFEGVLANLRRRYEETESESTRQRLRGYMSRQPCTECGGARLRPESLSCTIAGKSILDVSELSIQEALTWFEELELSDMQEHIVGEVIGEIRHRLNFLNDVGLTYLTLDRHSGTLSGGEAQRIRLATQIGAGLAGVLYVLDEPSIGLHQRDNERLLSALFNLRDIGNTVIVVEHDEHTIRSADYVVDLGPGAGRHGGEIVCQGSVEDLLGSARSLTARYLTGRAAIAVPSVRCVPVSGWLEVRGAAENNLADLDVRFPLGLFICVTGVSGSGKSTLVDTILRRALFRKLYQAKDRPGRYKSIKGMQLIDKAIVIDQSPIGRTPRSNPATYTGAFSLIRDLFARLPQSRVRGYGPGRFSFNVKGGRCEACKGDGVLRIEMHFLPDVYVTCEQCTGRRYNKESLEIHYKGRSIAEVLAMTIDEALDFFQAVPGIERKLRTLSEVGLGYLQLGQAATTLSGGEAQRLKLAAELAKKSTGRTVYILDEPTTGLHFADVHRLVQVLNRLRDAGNTLIVIEHNLDIIKVADHIIDLGPEGGAGGGALVAEGPPEAVACNGKSHTGRHLRAMLADAGREDEVAGAESTTGEVMA